MNGVQVFASVGNAAKDGHVVRREEEVRKEAEMFATVASTEHGRLEVSFFGFFHFRYLLFDACHMCTPFSFSSNYSRFEFRTNHSIHI